MQTAHFLQKSLYPSPRQVVALRFFIFLIGSGSAAAATPFINTSHVSAGGHNSCVISEVGGAKCWGANYSGSIGDGTIDDRWIGVDVQGLTSGVATIEAGNHSCALTVAGDVKCWGFNQWGSIGDGTTENRPLPTTVVGLTEGTVALATGYYHSCALSVDGGVQCWGYNDSGQLGDGTTETRLTPTQVVGLEQGVVAISSGATHSCAVMNDGGLKCWGYNGWGQLGDGSTTRALTPVDVTGLPGPIEDVEASNDVTCARTVAESVLCWGANYHGQLGDGTTVERSTPGGVIGLGSGVIDLASGGHFSCAVLASGEVKCWGLNDIGQLGNGTLQTSLEPTNVGGLTVPATQVGAGDAHACARMQGGGIQCWGYNNYGQLGDNSEELRLSAVVALMFTPPAPQSIVVTGEPTSIDSGDSASFSVTGGGSGIPVEVESTTPIQCAVSGLGTVVVSAFGAGQCIVRATQSGNSDFEPAPPIEITIEINNTPPTASADTFTQHETVSIIGNVLANDSDPGNDVLVAAVAVQPSSGTLLLSTDGTFEYVPAAWFLGADAFSYIVTDSFGAQSQATATLTVPMANATRQDIAAGIAITGLSALSNGEIVLTTDSNKIYRRLSDLSPKHTLTIGNAALNSAALLSDGTAYLAGSNTFLYAFSPLGVSLDHWPRALGSAVAESMSVAESGSVFVCPENGIVQVVSRQNVILGSALLGGPCAASPLLLPDAGLAVVVSTSGDGAIFSLDEFSGQELSIVRRFQWPSPPATSMSALTASAFVWLDQDGNLQRSDALDPSMSVSSDSPIGFDAVGSLLTLEDESVIIAGNATANGRVCRFTSNLAVSWCIDLDSKIRGSGALGRPGEAFFGLENGTLVSVDLENGDTISQVRVASSIQEIVGPHLASDVLFDGNRVLVGDSLGSVAVVPVAAIDSFAKIVSGTKTTLAPLAYWSGPMGGPMRNGRAHATQADGRTLFENGFEP